MHQVVNYIIVYIIYDYMCAVYLATCYNVYYLPLQSMCYAPIWQHYINDQALHSQTLPLIQFTLVP